uniref:ATP synthase complex subunit 8 n=1 Tax=Spizella wortheni TaxID=708585 RepID=G2ZHE9_9PASS|nr:ATPase subunit 8 [Spizella wortheni]
MAQMKAKPWFFIKKGSWLTLSVIIQPKLLSFVTMNPPSNKPPITPSTTPWTWPWT